MSDDHEPWAYVATRGTAFRGVIAATLGAKSIKEFYMDFAGCDIKAVFSRDEYLTLLKSTDATP